MILISIQPFAAKKLCALAATLACLSTASCFADAMYLSVKSAASERQMAGVQSVHQASACTTKRQRSRSIVNDSITDLGQSPYGYRADSRRATKEELRDASDRNENAAAAYDSLIV